MRDWYIPGSHRSTSAESFLLDPEFDDVSEAVFAEIERAASLFDGEDDA